jgi:hypothetical protein
MKFMSGDFIGLIGYSTRSRLVRFLISIRYGIPFKKAMSHVMSFVNSREVVSAEASGTKVVDISCYNKGCYMKV